MNSRLSDTEECISDLEDRIIEITQSKEQKEKQIFKNEYILRDIWDNIKHTKMCIIGMPGEDRGKGFENVFEETMAENFPNLKKETDTQVEEAQRVPNKMNPKRPHKSTSK